MNKVANAQITGHEKKRILFPTCTKQSSPYIHGSVNMLTQVPKNVIFAYLPTLEIILKTILCESCVIFEDVGNKHIPAAIVPIHI